MVGKTISHYKIIEKIGSGGMGEVYLADDTKLKRQVAIKFLPEHLTKDKENIERFEREAEAAAALNHPNIVTIHDVIEEDGNLCIVMEYVEGKSLREVIDEYNLGRDKVIDIISQLSEGLSKAHKAGIVHRDIKPENIIIDHEARVKILDFGLAKLKGVSKLTKETSTLGTIHYMSPEQLQGKEVDHRSDIWSLGVVIYELLTGEVPFKGDYESAVMYAVLNENVKPTDDKDLPEELLKIINKCLTKDPTGRYQNADEIKDDLIFLKEESSVKPTRRIHSDKKRYFKIAIPVLVAIIAVVTFLFVDKEAESTSTIQIAVVDFVNETGDSTLNGLSGLLITALEQSRRLAVITRSRLFDILKQLDKEDIDNIDEKLGREIAIHAKIKVLVIATIRKFDQMYNIDLKVIDPIEDKYLFADKVDGEGKAMISPMIDQLAENTREGLEESEEEIRLTTTPVAEITTSNIEAYHHYFNGQEYIEKYLFMEAEQEFEKAIALDSTFGLAYYRLAYAINFWEDDKQRAKEPINKAFKYIDKIPDKDKYLVRFVKTSNDSGWGEAALNILKDMEKIYPNDKEMIYNIGDIFCHIGKFEDAKKYLEKVLQIDPNSVRALQHLTWAYRDLEDYHQMLRTAKDYVSISGSRESYWELANAYINLKDLESGIKEIEKHIELFSDHSADIIPAIILLYFSNGENKKANDILTSYFEKYPDNTEFISQLGWNLLRQDKIEGAHEIFKRLYNKTPNNKDFLTGLGISKLMLGEYILTEKILLRVFEKTPNDPLIINLLGAVYQGLNKYEVAEKYFQLNLDLNPNFIYCDYSFATIKMLQGDYITAERHLLKAYQSDSTDWVNSEMLGFLYVNQNRFTDAKMYANKAFKIDTSYYTYNLLSWVLVKSGYDVDQGIALAKNALYSRPSHILKSKELRSDKAIPEYTIGLGYQKKGDYNQALDYLEKAHLLLPHREDIKSDLEKAKKHLTNKN